MEQHKIPQASYLWIICLAMILVACAVPTPGIPTRFVRLTDTPTLSPSPLPSTTLTPHLTTTFPQITPTIIGSMPEAHLVLAFFDAYNTAQVDAALALVDDQIQIGDCDFLINKPIAFRGKEGAAEWLRQRITDHDRLIVNEIMVGDLSSDTSRDAVGVGFARRINDTLWRLGYRDGINQNVGAKVILTKDHRLINTLALGPGFISTFTCYSYFGIAP